MVTEKKRAKKVSGKQRPPLGKDPPPAVPDRRAMEQVMADLGRLLDGQTFEGIEDIKRFVDELLAETGGIVPSQVALTPLEKAQDLVYQAWEADGSHRVKLARKALETSPDCADAYVLLAGEAARTVEEAHELYAQGVAAGERALGERTFREDVGHFWGLLSTRPYMRARAGLAHCLWEMGKRDAAVEHLQDMLRLNPGDNQGLRFVLAGWLLELGRDDELARLLDAYRECATAAWAYTWALWSFRRQDDNPESRRRLRKALQTNPHVPDYLLGRRRLPRDLPQLIGLGDDSEAVDYAARALDLWRQTPGALDWLAAAARRAGT